MKSNCIHSEQNFKRLFYNNQ